MEKYTNYCTGEQTLRSVKLGFRPECGTYSGDPHETRPFVYREPEPNCIAWNNSACWFCPTTQEMINWLRKEKGTNCQVYYKDGEFYAEVIDLNEDEKELMCINGDEIVGTYEQAELSAINAALDYLEK